MFDRKEARIWQVSLPQIETTVSAYLGPGCVWPRAVAHFGQLNWPTWKQFNRSENSR